jgi:hypothetical protein
MEINIIGHVEKENVQKMCLNSAPSKAKSRVGTFVRQFKTSGPLITKPSEYMQ